MSPSREASSRHEDLTGFGDGGRFKPVLTLTDSHN